MNDKLASIEVMARMTDIPLKAKEIVEDWLLLTYDIPKSEAGNKARRDFLSQIHLIGGVQHTASVYYMPWTQEAEQLAFKVAKVGKAVVWSSTPTDKAVAKDLTNAYDTQLMELLDDLEARLDKIQAQWDEKHYKRAQKMAEATLPKAEALAESVKRRGSDDMFKLAQILVVRARRMT